MIVGAIPICPPNDIGVSVMVEGDLDLPGTPGTPGTRGTLERLKLRTERYCVVLQTLLTPPAIEANWDVPS